MSSSTPSLWQHRIAVATFFFVNGFLFANWTSRLPRVQQFFGVSNAELGSLLFVSAVGAVLAMPFVGWLTTRYGTHQITRISGLIFCALVPLLPITSIVWFASFIFFSIGFSVGSMDVSMNGQAVMLERLWKKSIMSSFHALFSIGMALGALSGALFVKIGVDLQEHFLVVGVLGFIADFIASFFLITEAPSHEGGGGHFRLPTKAILPIGFIAFCGMTGEGAMADWSAIFMSTIVGASEAFSAIALGTFSAAMTLGRLFGDFFTMRLGKAKLLLLDATLALFGLMLLLSVVHPWVALSGFFLIGIGLATVVPIIYSTAGNVEGIRPSVGIAMATTIGYSGFFVGPPTIGYLADLFNLRWAFLFVLFLFCVMLFLIFLQKKQGKL